MNLFELTRALLDIPSVTGEEGEAGQFLASYLEDLNYRVEAQEVAGNRSNILGTTTDPPRVVLSTHIDTVPPHFTDSEDDEFIYGRGACDAKGIIAAQICAAEKLRAEGIPQIGLLFVVDEEVNSAGARAANTHPRAAECRYLIDGEPTENKLAVGSKGSLRVRLTAQGRAAHSAYPEAGESAIERLLDALVALRACNWPRDEFFGNTTCNIGLITGGTRSNVIPAEASAELQLRLVTPVEPVMELLKHAVAGRARLEVLSTVGPVRTLAIQGFDQTIVRFTTDIPHLTQWGVPLLLGPGSILDAHIPRERIAKRQLLAAVDLYARLARELLAQDRMLAELGATEGATR